MVCEIFFCPKFSDIPEKSRQRTKTDSKAIVKRYALKANPTRETKISGNIDFKRLTKIQKNNYIDMFP